MKDVPKLSSVIGTAGALITIFQALQITGAIGMVLALILLIGELHSDDSPPPPPLREDMLQAAV